MGQSAKLSQFDYGPKVNLEVYGSRIPTEYNLTLVTAPVALLFSNGDTHISSEVSARAVRSKPWLLSTKILIFFFQLQDVFLFKNKLPNVVASYRIDKHLFNHMDFVWGNEARTEVFDFILEVLNRLDDENTETNESLWHFETKALLISIRFSYNFIVSICEP